MSLRQPSHWSLTTFRTPNSSIDRAGIILGPETIVQPAFLTKYDGLVDALRDWDVVAPQLVQISPESLPAIQGATSVAPLRFPNKLICAGANYYDHIAEMGAEGIPDGSEPFFFLLPPTTTIIGPGAEIAIPGDPAAKIDWEAELAIVVGRRAKNIPSSDANSYIAGYACFNDITARGYHRRPVSLAPPFSFDWLRAKGLDSFCPMGPITPSWMIDPADLSIRCFVNDRMTQNGNTKSMIFGLAKLVSFASQICTLEPGDVIATGTPAGVGAVSGNFLKAGDHVRVEIDGLFPLNNIIVGSK